MGMGKKNKKRAVESVDDQDIDEPDSFQSPDNMTKSGKKMKLDKIAGSAIKLGSVSPSSKKNNILKKDKDKLSAKKKMLSDNVSMVTESEPSSSNSHKKLKNKASNEDSETGNEGHTKLKQKDVNISGTVTELAANKGNKGLDLNTTVFTTQEDYDFIRYHLDMVPPHILMDKSKVIEEDSDEDEMYLSKGKPLGKKSGNKGSFTNKTASAMQADNDTSTGTSSKIKEKMKHKKHKKNKKESTDTEAGNERSQMLREKLVARIEELKGKRNLTTDELLEKKRLRRRESKLKKKMTKKEDKNKGNLTKPEINGDVPVKKPAVTPVKDKSTGKMVFSKFDFVDSGDKEAPQNNFKGKDFKRLLEKVEKKKQKIEKLKETNPDAAKAVASKESWKKVMAKAEGEKIKDDPNLLKKSLKKKEKFKEKRKKQWDERTSQTEHRMKAQQDKRQKNIDSRKKAKIDKKIQRSKKKGRNVPGF
ncbi:surfeit locus protein 6 homolog [Mytilus trossulus]|uniref:surfeit locus protein 6 homolog n=1 Tax=Mytilus trossulus TaxID=6551 RepID=UPI0030070019